MLNTRSTLKSIIVIFALASAAAATNLQASSAQTAESFVQSLELYNEVVLTQINDGSPEQAMELSRQALNEALETSRTDLDEHFDGLGDKFYSMFIKGLEQQIAGYSENDNQQIASGQEALDSWSNWYASNLDNIRRTN